MASLMYANLCYAQPTIRIRKRSLGMPEALSHLTLLLTTGKRALTDQEETL